MMNQTQPNQLSDTQPRRIKKTSRAGFWISLLILISALALGSTAGYGEGIRERLNAEETLVSQQLSEQMTLAQADQDAGRYDIARQRLEHIARQDPNYPNVVGKLSEVLAKQAITPSPVPTATPTVTPTPDLRSQEAIFAQAETQMQNKDWTGLLGSLDSIRKADPTYKVVRVDGMYYTALRNRGVDQISGSGAYGKIPNMEGGMYDLTLAERFGPLDGYADGLRTGARLYIKASSFWDVNWSEAVNYFRQVYQYYPNLRDASNVTAAQRLHEALLKYGDQVASLGKLEDRCRALELWGEANTISQLDGTYATRYNQLNGECNPPTAEAPAVDPNLTPTTP